MNTIGKCMILFLTLVACVGFFLLCGGFSAQAEEELKLLYDDRKELYKLVDATGEVSISNEQVTSFKVGTTTKDDHVLVYRDGVLYAVGTGTATLTVGEKSYAVTVSPAPISLFMVTGHSGGAGQEGNGSQSVAIEAGQAYSSYHQNSLDVTEVDGYGLGWGSEKRVGGEEGLVRKGWDSYGHIDAFAPGMGGCTSSTSGFAYRWNQRTGEKVWMINIAIGGSCINEWLPGAHGHNTAYDLYYYNQTVSKFTYAQTILKNEVAAGHYTLSKQGIINFGGSNFSWYTNWSNESIQQDYEILWDAYKKDLFNIDITGDGTPDGLDVMALVVSCSSQVYSGDRPALWYMGSSGEYTHNVLLSSLVKNLYTLDGIRTHFPEIDYTTQSIPVSIPDSVYHINQGGTSENSVFSGNDGVHLNQVVNNAQGEEMAENLYKWFFVDNCNTVAESVRFEDRNYKTIADNVNITVGESFLLVPRTEPITVNDLTYEVTGAAELEYPLAVKGTSVGTATLTVKQGDRVIKTMTFNVSEAHSHCVCGDKELNGHTCGDAEVYVPLNSYCFTNWRYVTSGGTNTYTSNALRSGNYYLTGDYNVSGSIFIVPGAKVNLCLNGYKLTTGGRSISINGELNICDCDGSGGIHSKSAGNAPTVYTGSGGVLNIYGGTFSAIASSTREFGGCFGLSNDLIMQNCDLDGDGTLDNTTKKAAVATIYGGKFIGSDLNCADGSPSVTGSGACGFVGGSTTLTVYGGEFIGARAVLPEDGGTGGGGIIGVASGTAYIYGGKFTGSTDSLGAIWTNISKVHIGGNPIFENNNNADIFLHYCDHFYVDSALTNETPIRIAGSTDNYTKVHLSCAEDLQHLTGGHDLTMGTPDADNIVKFTRNRTYCECGGTLSEEAKTLSGHVCKDATWTSVCQGNLTASGRFTTTSTTPSQTSTARYYLRSKEVWLCLSGNINLTNEIEISEGYTLHIDLNGYTITHAAGSASLFRVYGTLTICDTYGGGRAVGVRTGTKDAEAACVYVLNYNSYAKTLCTPAFHFYGGTLSAFNVTSATDRTRLPANQGGVVQVGNNSGNKSALFNMYGGTIKDGYAEVAGNLLVGHGIMNMYDGLITGGQSTTYGGNVRIGSGNTFTMYGGTISNGHSGSYGANIQLSSGTNRILGGTIENGLADSNGGNVYLGGGTLEIRNAKLIGGAAKSSGGGGGNLYVYAGTANVYDTVLKNGMAGYTYERNEDGTLSYSTTNAPSGNGGNVYINNATANFENCALENGLAFGKNSTNGIGGHIYNRYTLTMNNCTLTDGSGFRGGAIGIRDSSSSGANYTELKSCTFSGHTGTVLGSSIGTWTDTKGCQIVIENCSFDDSHNASCSVIALDNATANKNPVTLTVISSTVKANGNAIWCDYGTVNLEGTLDLSENLNGLNLSGTAQIAADNFTPAKAVSVTSTANQIGTSATDKSDCFAHATQGIVWADGKLSLGTGLIKGVNGTYKTFAAALAAGETYLQLLDNHEGSAEITTDLYLDLNGKTLTGDITGSGTLYGMDTATDKYSTENMGRITGTVSCNVEKQFKTDVSGKIRRYMAIADENGYTFHRFWLGVTHINLKPGVDGVGYKAAIYGDEQVQAQVTGYGYTLWIGENGKKLSAGKEGSFVSGKTVTARLQNFDVASYGEETIYGSVYLTLQDGTTIESTSCSYTFRNLVEQIAASAESFTAEQLAAVKAMLAPFDTITSNWNIEGLQ